MQNELVVNSWRIDSVSVREAQHGELHLSEAGPCSLQHHTSLTDASSPACSLCISSPASTTKMQWEKWVPPTLSAATKQRAGRTTELDSRSSRCLPREIQHHEPPDPLFLLGIQSPLSSVSPHAPAQLLSSLSNGSRVCQHSLLASAAIQGPLFPSSGSLPLHSAARR